MKANTVGRFLDIFFNNIHNVVNFGIASQEMIPYFILTKQFYMQPSGKDAVQSLADKKAAISTASPQYMFLFKTVSNLTRSCLILKSQIQSPLANPDTFEIITANEATSKLYGYDMDELPGMSCLTFSAEEEESRNASRKSQEEEVG